MAQKCTGKKPNGTPCKAWATPGSDPPRCHDHPKNSRKAGAPKGNKNAEKHGAYSGGELPTDLDARIAALDKSAQRLERYIDVHILELDAEEMVKLLTLQGQLTRSIGRLMRDRQQVTGEDADTMQQDISAALTLASELFGVNLTGSG